VVSSGNQPLNSPIGDFGQAASGARAAGADANIPLRINLLGGFSVEDAAGNAIGPAGQKDKALLAYLALSRGVAQPRDKLAALLWSDHGDRQARDSLKQCLLRLRRALAAAAPGAIVADRQTVGLDGSGIDVDVAGFERLAGDADLKAVAEGVAFYRGDLLEGLNIRAAAFEDWVLVERQRLRQLAVDALARLLRQPAVNGARDRIAAAARRLLAFDPLHEAACRALMQFHADRDERIQALKLFEGLRDRLQQELGVAPEPETVRLYKTIRQRRAEDAPAAAAECETPAAAIDPARAAMTSIAILPFANGGGTEQAEFADGLTEAVIADLSRVSALFVAARDSVFALKERNVDGAQAARELNVRYVLEGSVRQSGDRLRITARLVDSGTAGHVWAMRYDRNLDDIFVLQDEISKTIVDVLRVRLLPSEMEHGAGRATANSAAYRHYLTGRSFYLRGFDRRSLRIAREMYAKAVEIDPGFACAHAGIAICDGYLSMSDPDVSWDTVLAESEHALGLEPDLAEAHAARGLALCASGRHADSLPAFERAVQLNPALFEGHFFWGECCQLLDQHEKAAALFQRAAELRPNDFRALGFLATSCRALGRLDEAQAAVRRCVERVEAAVQLHPDNAGALAFGAIAFAELGRREQAAEWAERAIMIGPDDHLAHYNVACAHLFLGNIETALTHLERALAASPSFRCWLANWLAHDPDFAPLRTHPRYRALIERAAAADDSPPIAVAVLPFANIGGDPEQEYFADGLTDDIITDLSQLSALRVVARRNAFAFKGHADIQEAARALGVRYVLEGCVRKAGNRLRITVRLVDGETGDGLWTTRYDRGRDDVFALQDEISKCIVDTLRVKLLPAERETLGSRATRSAAAYDYYLMGRSFYLRGIDIRSLGIARGMFAKAAEIDPDYARAYAGIAICDSYLSMRDSEASYESTMANSARALELDANLAEAYAARGLALYGVGRFAEARADFERAIARDPELFEAHFFDGRCRRIQGQRQEAAALFARAAELRPNDFRSLGLLAEEYKALGRADDAAAAARRCLERLVAELRDHPDNGDAWAFGAAVLAGLDEPARAEDWAARAAIIAGHDYLVNYNLARAFALLGQPDPALERLERAFGALPLFRRRLAAWLPLDEDLAGLRNEPRFRALEARIAAEFPSLG
jgi:adenylate cyclase